jgi:hypothetical protein
MSLTVGDQCLRWLLRVIGAPAMNAVAERLAD